MDFKLISPYRPTGDQPEAIDELSRGILDGTPYQFKPQQNSGRTII